MSEPFHTIGAIDAHCHAFVPEDAAADLSTLVTLSEEPLPPGDVRSTVLFRRLVRELSGFLGVDATDRAVTDARSSALADDRDGYYRSLFSDAGLEMLLCDIGHPIGPDHRTSIELKEFSSVVGTPCRPIFRIESAADRLLIRKLPFAEFVVSLEAEIDDAVATGAVGLKSVIAYLSGLDVEIVDRATASRSYDALQRGNGENAAAKDLWDFLFLRGLERAIEHSVPLQIHTGMGDGPRFDMTTARPILLRRLLFDPALRRATIVLTHAGYPWVEESGWLANQYENVHIDVSEMVPFAANGVTSKLLGLFEMAPTTKLMFGTDGFNAPELHWFGARMARRALDAALTALRASEWITEAESHDIARAFLRDNAARVYGLDEALRRDRTG